MRPRILLPIIMLVTLVGTTAQAAITRLHITAYNNAPITVFVDGVQYGQFSDRQKIEGLRPGVHNLRVVALEVNPYSVHNRQIQVYNGPVNVANGFQVTAIVQPNNLLTFGPTVALLPNKPVHVRPTNNGVCGTPTGPIPVDPVVVEPYPVSPYPAPLAMHPQQFEEVLSVIRQQRFESTRANVARQILNEHYFTSAQIVRVLELFNFDSYRLDMAKYAYTRVVDPERYYLTYNVFTFNSSVNELSRYIGSIG